MVRAITFKFVLKAPPFSIFQHFLCTLSQMDIEHRIKQLCETLHFLNVAASAVLVLMFDLKVFSHLFGEGVHVSGVA